MDQSLKKSQSLVHENNNTWNDLKNAWRSYKVAKMKDDKVKMAEFATTIRILQKNIGAKISEFPELIS
jgi:hypothetical protein